MTTLDSDRELLTTDRQPYYKSTQNGVENGAVKKLLDGAKNTTVTDDYDNDGTLKEHLEIETESYHRRWYVLIVFFIVGIMQGWMWNTFNPIAEPLRLMGWPLYYIAFMQVILAAASAFGAPLCSWIMNRKGLRLAMLFAVFTLALACSIRCFTASDPAFITLTMLSYVIDGLGGTVSLSGAPAFSAVWFPPRQRAFATAICVSSTSLGIAFSFLIGPSIVVSHSLAPSGIFNGTIASENVRSAIKGEVMQIMYIECAISIVLLVVVLIYFPKKPPKPPCLSQACERVSFKKGIQGALKSWKLWLLLIPYSTSGIYYSWSSVYNVILKPVGISVMESGWLCFYSVMAGVGTPILLSLFAGLIYRYMKMLLILLLVIAAVAVAIFSSITNEYIEFSLELLYASAIIAGAAVYACIPLCFELACEVIYPISEDIVCMIVQWWNIFFVIGFFLLLMIPDALTWLNWVVLSFVMVGVLSSVIFPATYSRLSVDENLNGDEPQTEDSHVTNNERTD